MHEDCCASGNCSWYADFLCVNCCYIQLLDPDCNLGLNVVEVAHDMQHQVSRYVSSDLRLTNSFDTWHGKLCCNNNVRKLYLYPLNNDYFP